MLARCVDIRHGRSNGYAVEVGDAVCEKTALNTGMNGFNRCLVAGELFPAGENSILNNGIGIVCPAGIIALRLALAAGKSDNSVYLRYYPFLLRSHGATNGVGNVKLILIELENAEVAGGLNKTGHINAHFLNAVGKCKDNICNELAALECKRLNSLREQISNGPDRPRVRPFSAQAASRCMPCDPRPTSWDVQESW